MKLDCLRISGLRCLQDVDIVLDPAINVFVGDNGAGKTSLLEAVFLLSRARSFRSGAREALLQRGATGLSVYAELVHPEGCTSRLGLGREGARWSARVNGERAAISDLVHACAVVCFEPGSHALIAGGAEERRRYMDWGVFHVEPDFLTLWQRHQRALKQRNSLLRSPVMPLENLFQPWERELAASSQAIHRQRENYLHQLRPLLSAAAAELLPELGPLELRYRRGWAEDQELAALLDQQRGRDRARGHTTVGAHRADWSVAFAEAPLREHLSRGQEKLTALATVLAQARLFATHSDGWPVVCLDDLASELDSSHQRAVVKQLVAAGAQVLLTGTELPEALKQLPARVFHVKQGQLARLL